MNIYRRLSCSNCNFDENVSVLDNLWQAKTCICPNCKKDGAQLLPPYQKVRFTEYWLLIAFVTGFCAIVNGGPLMNLLGVPVAIAYVW